MNACLQRVALIRPLHGGEELEFQEPLGPECLAGSLGRAGWTAELFDRRLYERRGLLPAFWEDFCARVPYEAVGFSLMTAEDLPDALRLIQRMKLSAPAPRFVLGGLFVTLAGERQRAVVPRDVALICGEGETQLLSWLERADLRASEQSGSGPPTWAPAWRPQLADYLAQGCAINIRGGRGCSGACAFCATPALAPAYRLWAGRDISEVVDEVAALATRAQALGQLPIFNFVEDDFGPLARVEELDAELRARGLRIAYSLQMRGLSLLKEADVFARMARLHEGGFCRLFIGVESMTAATLRAWHKPLDPDALLALLGRVEQAGIRVHIGYILWHEDSTPESVRREVIALHEQGFFSTKCVFNRMVLFPGAALYAEDIAAGKRAGTVWQALSPTCEELYQKLTSWLRPLYLVWVRAATALPQAAARAYLTGDATETARLDAVLAVCDRIAYGAVADADFSADIAGTAARLDKELDEIRCPRT